MRSSLVLILLGSAVARADQASQACLLEQLDKADETLTVKELRARCATDQAASAKSVSVPAAPQVKADSADVPPAKAPVVEVSEQAPSLAPAPAPAIISERLAQENGEDNKYAILAHRPNYLLLASYNERRPDNAPFARDASADSSKAQKLEAKFQISLKAPIVTHIFDDEDGFYGAYTQRSVWQVYNRVASAPFRETNYEPELWYQHGVNQSLLGWKINGYVLGVNHQSNGRAKDFSRSWNRVFAAAAMERGSLGMMLRSWVRLKEDPTNDDNPDITRFMGNFDLTMVGKAWGHSWDLMIRNNLHRHTNRGAVQFGWSFPLTSRFRGYMQWFKGYGETLIDYNHYQNTIGMGVMLTDW
ncbi:phospholipase A [Uliginosibacterium gangwonense]|uniref:phospholipase A n=1 Tax=Uliginosibacterium gangwonense TaxID=392736 RepID=UPI0012F8319D|nr:phospholipase A [Uliginosibacterium gangwonense]